MKKKNVFTDFENVESQDLVEILRTELEKRHPDRELVLGILDVLQKRDAKDPTREDIDVDAMWQRFLAYQDVQNARLEACAQKERPRRKFPKVAIAAVLVLALLLVAPPAFGAENIVELVGRWSQDIFALFWSDSPEELSSDYVFQTDHPGLQELYDTVAEAGITQKVVPMWVPEECELQELKIVDTLEGKKIRAKLADNNCHILIVFEPFSSKPSNSYPKDDVDPISYESGGIKHYMVPNNDTWSIIWAVDDISCSVFTTYNEEIIHKIIDSIYAKGA